MKKIDLKKLAEFLVEAKKATYAGKGAEVKKTERKGAKELLYKRGNLEYRDSYFGFLMAPGQEIVRMNGKPIWAMAYSGGMRKKFAKLIFAKRTFGFLKEALSKIPLKEPFRGPKKLSINNWQYECKVKGDICNFFGKEKIKYNGKTVFEQNYIGGAIIGK